MNAEFKARLKQFAERIDALSLRERGLVFAGALGALFVLANSLVFPDLRAKERALNDALMLKQQQVAVLRQHIQDAAMRQGKDPNEVLRARIAELKRSLGAVNVGVMGVVTPAEMAKLARALLAEHNVQLARMANLPPEPFDGEKREQKAGVMPVETGTAGLYRHGLRLEVRGSYADLVNYLQALERLEWQVLWGDVELRVEKHPTSRLSLTLYTLSPERAWIGM